MGKVLLSLMRSISARSHLNHHHGHNAVAREPFIHALSRHWWAVVWLIALKEQ
jgi:hypothetical protein